MRVLAIVCSLATVMASLACHDSTPPAPITVTTVSPDVGTVVGGTVVTIIGTSFVEVTNVTIGGLELADRTVVSPAQIIGTTPSATTFGPMDVIVTSTSHGQGVCRRCFSFEPLDVGPHTLVAGAFHTCALDHSGAPYCWGDNYYGQVGNPGALTWSSRPLAVVGGLQFVSLGAGNGHTCGLTSSGEAYCWGYNGYGQFGDGSLRSSDAPVRVADGQSFSTVAAAGASYTRGYVSMIGYVPPSGHTCGLSRAGAAYCWGNNVPLGLSSAQPRAISSSLPLTTLATGGASSNCGVSSGCHEYSHTCALTRAGAAYCWGDNASGQLGKGWTSSDSAVAVAGGLSFTALATGGLHTCGIVKSGAAYCWGNNEFGQLGIGQLVGTPIPLPVEGGLSFIAIAAGRTHTCGLATTGAAYCWGANHTGRLGDGSTTLSKIPVAVFGGLSFSALALGTTHTCGLTTSDSIYCWGGNEYGQLGDGTTTNSSVPVKVAGQPQS